MSDSKKTQNSSRIINLVVHGRFGNLLLLNYVILTVSLTTLFAIIPEAYAESQSFTVAARDYEQISIFLHKSDEMEFSISVSGGTNDDINMIIALPDGTKTEGMIYEKHHENFVAPQSGSYVFTFDNTISVISNKSVQFSYQITKNSYYVYIGELPDYAKSYAGNAVYEGTEYWKNVFPELNFYVVESQSEADVMIQWVKDFSGVEHIGFQYEKLVEVGLGDSYCGGEWRPYSSDYVNQIMIHELGHAIGLAHSDDPNDIMYPTSGKTQYGIIEQEFTITKRHAKFVPFCLGQEVSAIEYAVSTNDPTYGFDVYVIPSVESVNNWSQGLPFSYYSGNSCYGAGYLEYSGFCEGVSSSSGLLIIMDKDSTNPLTQVSVKTLEKKYVGHTQQTSQTTHSYPQENQLGDFGSSEELEKTFQMFNVEPKEEAQPVEPSKTNDSKKSDITCGAGTIEKDGVCVPAKQEKTSETKSGGGCLIATATFGTELVPQVQLLREIRENTLLTTNSGTAFLDAFNDAYYSFSPTIADFERQNPVFKEIVKITITPMLSTLSILNYVDINSDQEMLGYGISIILLNVGMYFVVPAIVILKIRSRFS